MKKPYYDYARVMGRVSQYHFNLSASNNLPIEIFNYRQALDWWRQRKGLWRDSSDRPVGKPSDYTRRMRQRPDKSIEFEYNGHSICTWHPDSTLTVDPYDTHRWGPFDQHVMPRSIEVGYGARCGKIIYLRDTFANGVLHKSKYDRVKVEGVSGTKFVVNPEIMVIRAEKPVTLQRDGKSERWLPVNEMRCKPFYWYELDRGQLREASKKYNLPEFISAISTALAMGADIKTNTGFGYVQTRTNNDGEDVLTLLEQGRFVDAAGLVRAAEDRHYDHTLGKWVTETRGLSSTDIKKIRQTAYVEMGLIYLETARMVSLPEYNNIERKLLDFGVPAE